MDLIIDESAVHRRTRRIGARLNRNATTRLRSAHGMITHRGPTHAAIGKLGAIATVSSRRLLVGFEPESRCSSAKPSADVYGGGTGTHRRLRCPH